MDRRTFLKSFAVGGVAVGGAAGFDVWLRRRGERLSLEAVDMPSAAELPFPLGPAHDPEGSPVGAQAMHEGCCERARAPGPSTAQGGSPPTGPETEGSSRGADSMSTDSDFDGAGPGIDRARAIEKTREFNRSYSDDFVVEGPRYAVLERAATRLARVERFVGFGHFNLISFDDLLRISRHYSKVGAFTREELDFLEEIFEAEAARYGFFGDKVIHQLTHEIPERETQKISGSGHYLLRGPSREKFDALRRDLGDSIVLTSGVRSLGKQFKLFLAKAVVTRGNLSQAARSLAPPGYSYHAVGDFDLGARGLGEKNFTESFAQTREYKKMIELGYVSIRYDVANPYGVRHEPWHIQVV